MVVCQRHKNGPPPRLAALHTLTRVKDSDTRLQCPATPCSCPVLWQIGIGICSFLMRGWHILLSSIALCFTAVVAHGDHAHKPTQQETRAPVDARLWLHIGMEATAWAVLFPLAMVLGLVRHRFHVPLSILAVTVSLIGFLFGQNHGGRQFSHTVHGTFATILFFALLTQAACGIYLRLHLTWSKEKYVRPVVLGIHGVLGRAFPVIGWTQMVFGIATLQSWCNGGHLGQCLAHYIMGSAFAAYSVILLIMMKCAVEWLRRRGFAQEYLDSWVILLWGIVNSFTEHHGGPWTHKDLQHTLMGVVWWAGGAAGIWVSRRGARSVFPAIIIMLTGWAMSGHKQAVAISTEIHALFGYTLMAGGLCRVIEICFVLNEGPSGSIPRERRPGEWFPVSIFQYLPPFLLVSSGILFMSATDEEMRWADAKGVDHVTWALIDFSVAFTLFLWFNVLIDTYVGYGGRYGLAAGHAKDEPFSYLAMEQGLEHVDEDADADADADAVGLEPYGSASHFHASASRLKEPVQAPNTYAQSMPTRELNTTPPLPPPTHVLEDKDPFDDNDQVLV